MTVTINGFECACIQGQTILDLAQENNIYIPTLCHEEELPLCGACGICVVEVKNVPRLLRACATPISAGMVINTNTEKVAAVRKTLLELLLSTHTGDCKAPCQLACPAETNCQGYISLIAEGKLFEAVKLMKEAHPFPASVARICPRPCEDKCRRNLVDEAVNIAGLKRYAADFYLKDAMPEILPDRNKKIAIAGGGPAGLTAAYFMRRAGYEVEVFEAMPKMGGLLRYGIPEYRLPKAILDGELKVLQNMGIIFKNNIVLGREITLVKLQSQYHAVIIAVGAGVSKPLLCEGEDSRGVFGGIDFLKTVASGSIPHLGKRAIVVGGSNTAMDVARTALRLGAEVVVSYRRGREEMPAEENEIKDAEAEGVKFLFLTAPLKITAHNGQATGIILQKMKLGEADESGRRRPVPVENAEEFLPANTIIGAVGQDIVVTGLNPLENLQIDENFRTQLPGVYAIGDVTGKSSYAIEAIGHGRTVAAAVLEDMQPWETIPKTIVKDEKTCADFAEIQKQKRQNETAIAHEPLNFSETHGGLTEIQAKKEAARCLSCGCEVFNDCKLLKLSNMYLANANKFSAGHKKIKYEIDERNNYIRRDMNKCVHCYLCVRVCDATDEKVLSAIKRGFPSTIDTAFGEEMPQVCNSCQKCAKHCPTGALITVSNK